MADQDDEFMDQLRSAQLAANSQSPAYPGAGSAGGDQTGGDATPPLPAVVCRETERVAGEDEGSEDEGSAALPADPKDGATPDEVNAPTGDPVGADAEPESGPGDEGSAALPNDPKDAEPESAPGGDSVQLRVRLPRVFAKLLLTLPPTRRALALWFALDAKIGDVWNIAAVISSVAELRKVGVLLNQACRYLGKGGEDHTELIAAVHEALRLINKLRRVPKLPAENGGS